MRWTPVAGGVRIDFPLGLQGHSDGDVVLHAVADALLGAAGLPDIGEQFPDTDPAYKDADSRRLLTKVLERLAAAGYWPVQLDCIVHAERPKLTGQKQRMAESIAALLELDGGTVNVKAKTNEGLGPVGTGEAIACTAVAVISRT
jgi:2-C-methyl-D-erythritol 2,4-cyclodiphosphate synthase